jgi:hypothetical protein
MRGGRSPTTARSGSSAELSIALGENSAASGRRKHYSAGRMQVWLIEHRSARTNTVDRARL